MYHSPSQYSHAGGVGGAARGAQVTRPSARRRRPAPPSYPPTARPQTRAALDEEIFALQTPGRYSLPMGERRLPRFSAFVAAALLIAAGGLWWWF